MVSVIVVISTPSEKYNLKGFAAVGFVSTDAIDKAFC
jgi:hypothetical protein